MYVYGSFFFKAMSDVNKVEYICVQSKITENKHTKRLTEQEYYVRLTELNKLPVSDIHNSLSLSRLLLLFVTLSLTDTTRILNCTRKQTNGYVCGFENKYVYCWSMWICLAVYISLLYILRL